MLHTPQVFGDGLAAWLAPGSSFARRRCRRFSAPECIDASLQVGLILGQSLLEQTALVGGHRLGLGAEFQALQPGQFKGQLLELGVLELDLVVAFR
jgi:hypothetical protein